MANSLTQADAGSVSAARAALREGRHEEALATAEQALASAPRNARLHAVAADACHRLGRPQDRIEHLRVIADIHPGDPRHWQRLANAVGNASGPDGAVEEMLGAHARHPLPVVKRELSDRYRRARRFDEALALWPGDDAEHRLARAEILLSRRSYDDAEAAYAGVLEIAPGNTEALGGLARAAQHREEWERAIERWRAASDAAPEAPEPLMHLAGILRFADDPVEAERHIQRAMTLLETAQPRRFWGQSQEPHEAALELTLEERVDNALEDQRRYLVTPDSPYHPGRPSPFDAVLAEAVEGRASSVLQYPSEVKFLASFLAEKEITTLFEVGLRHGAFATLLDRLLGLERVGGSEFIVTPRLEKLMRDERYEIFAGDHHGDEYRRWREAREPFDFVFIDGGHSFNDVTRDYLREREFRPRFIGFHDVWNIACLGAKRMWDELPGKLAYYCNTDPSEYMLTAYRDRNFATGYFDVQRESNGYCTGIGIIELDA